MREGCGVKCPGFILYPLDSNYIKAPQLFPSHDTLHPQPLYIWLSFLSTNHQLDLSPYRDQRPPAQADAKHKSETRKTRMEHNKQVKVIENKCVARTAVVTIDAVEY